jgi:hypothetical protein
VIDMALPLKSWTRNVPYPEGAELVCLAEGGMAVELWREKAEQELSQADPTYRQTLLRLVGRMFLDVVEETIVETPFLRMLKEGDEARRRDLFFARYALAHPWCLLAARRLILPRVARMGDAAEISLAEWDAFVSRYIEHGASEASRRKTRSTVIGVFQALGVVQRLAKSTAPTILQRAHPDGVAFGWVVADQLASELVGTASRSWCARESDAAALFACSTDHAEACLEVTVAAGELESVDHHGEPGLQPSAAHHHSPMVGSA